MPFYSLSLVLLGLATPALAASTHRTPAPVANALTPADGMKLVASTRSWDDITKAFKIMPTNVQKDLEAAIKDLPFPDVRYLNAGLVIRQQDGHQIKVVFGKHGKAFINGRPWRLNALAKPEEEIARITNLMLTKTASVRIFDFLISDAEAGAASAAAALTYASSTSWKAQSCSADEDYSEEQKHDCLLMGVAFHVPQPAQLRGSVQTGLKCPASVNDGTLSFTTEADDKSTMKGKIVYENGLAVAVEVSAYDSDGTNTRHYSVDFKTEQRQNMIDGGHLIVGTFDSVRTDVCGGPAAAKKEFLARLAANRDSFRLSDASDISGGGDGHTSMQ